MIEQIQSGLSLWLLLGTIAIVLPAEEFLRDIISMIPDGLTPQFTPPQGRISAGFIKSVCGGLSSSKCYSGKLDATESELLRTCRHPMSAMWFFGYSKLFHPGHT